MDRPGWLICSNANCRAEKGFREDIKTGDIICTLCGRVAHEKVIDMGSEWRNFGEGEDKSRAETIDDINDKMSTNITIGRSEEKFHASMSKLHQHITGNEQKSLTQASGKIAELGAQLSLPATVLKTSKQLYKDFDTKKRKKSAAPTRTPSSSPSFTSPANNTNFPAHLKNSRAKRMSRKSKSAKCTNF